MKIHVILMFVATVLFGLSSNLSAQTLYQHDFDNGELYPFMFDTNQGSRVTVVDGTLQTKWQEDLYDGSNMGRKAQFYPENQDGWHTQELWLGYHMKISSDYMKDDYDTDAGLMQVWGFDDATGKANHFVILGFEGRNGGSLTWSHRYMFGTSTKYLIADNFPRDEFVSIIVHFKLANKDEGIVQVWVDGELKLNKTNQWIGWGDMNENGMYNQSHFGAAMGQYNFRESAGSDSSYDGTHYYLGHKDGETRTVTFDNFSMYYDGPNGYNIVNPDGGGENCGDFDAFSTIEAEDYCDMSGIETESSSDDGGEQVGYINNGEWLKFSDVDFGSGASSFEARISSATSGGDIELHLGSATGELIGTCAVDGTGSWASFDTVSCEVNGASGVEDLYLVFTGDSGYLLNINWFKFTESEHNCYLPWNDDDFSVEATTVNYRSGAIDISCASSVEISMDLQGVGAMEDADYLNVYYKVDGGAQQVLSENINAFTEKIVSVSGISGDSVEIIADVYNSYAEEIYSLSNIRVTASKACADFSPIEAEDFSSMFEVVDEGANIGYIHSGDWAMYSQIDLSCARSLDVMASSQTSGGTIEVRLGSATGEIIGSVDVSGTGSWANYESSSVNLESVSGTHDVYFVFTGGSGYLFNIDWFEFSSL